MFRCILLPVDPARPFGAANQYAVDLAHRFGCRVVATYVIDERLLGHMGGEAAATLDTALEWVGHDAIEDFASHHQDLEVTRILSYGPTHTALFQMVLQTGADLVVLGGYHGPTATHVWGSTVADVVHHVERPTFVVRRPARLPQAGDRITVPYDGSERAIANLPRICGFAKECGAGVDLVHVTRPSKAAAADGVLAHGAELARSTGIEAVSSSLRASMLRPKWRTILAHAAANHSPLIAMSRLGQSSMETGRSRTVDHLVAQSDIPVWVVRK